MNGSDLIAPSLIVAVISYLLGSLSFSIIFTKFFEKKDIRTMGSGNAGATNVLRSVGPKAAICTFIFDFLKGVTSVLIGKLIFSMMLPSNILLPEMVQYGTYIAGFSCVFGHMFPIYFGFRGGKGILTTAAIIALIDWRVFLVVIITFLITFMISKIVSLSSILAAIMYPVGTFFVNYFFEYKTGNMPFRFVIVTSVATLCMAIVIVIRHHGNIRRILNGTEKQLSIKKHNHDNV